MNNIVTSASFLNRTLRLMESSLSVPEDFPENLIGIYDGLLCNKILNSHIFSYNNMEERKINSYF